jgi:hypothetical protein
MATSQTILITAYDNHCALLLTQVFCVIVLSQYALTGIHWKMVTRI